MHHETADGTDPPFELQESPDRIVGLAQAPAVRQLFVPVLLGIVARGTQQPLDLEAKPAPSEWLPLVILSKAWPH